MLVVQVPHLPNKMCLHAEANLSAFVMQAVLLFVNGLAILNNERFLEPCESSHNAAVASFTDCSDAPGSPVSPLRMQQLLTLASHVPATF